MIPLIAASLVAKFAPGLIRHLAGDKAGNVAEKVAGAALALTGAPTLEEASAQLDADPKLANEFRLRMVDYALEVERMELADTADARAMQVAALGQADAFSKRFVYYFATGWSVFAMVYFAGVTFIAIPPGGQRAADTILGVLIGTVLVGIFHYLYGTTRGSEQKTALLAQAQPILPAGN